MGIAAAREWRVTQRHLHPLPVAGRTVFTIEAGELDELLASYAESRVAAAERLAQAARKAIDELSGWNIGALEPVRAALSEYTKTKGE